MSLILPQRGRIRQAAAGAVTQQTIIDLNPYAFWSLNDLAGDVFQKTDEVTSAGSDNDPIGRIKDLSGNAFHLDQTNDISPDHRPWLDITSTINSVESSGGNSTDFLDATITAPPSACSMFIAVNAASDTSVMCFHGDGTHFSGVWQVSQTNSTYSNAGTPTTWVDGTQISPENRGALETAANLSSWVVIEVRDADISAWPSIKPCSFSSGFSIIGKWAEIVIIDNTDLAAGAGEAANRTTIMDWIKSQVGL